MNCNGDCFNCKYEDCVLGEQETAPKQYASEYYAKNRERICEAQRKWNTEHKEKRREYNKINYERHKRERKQYYALYYELHKEEIAKKAHERYIRRKQNEAGVLGV